MSVIINRAYFLVLIYILYVRIWNLKVFSFISQDALTAITLGILIIAPIYYRIFSRRRSLLNLKNSQPIIWIFVGIFISMFCAYLYHGQSFITSLTAYKVQYLMIGGFSLLAIAPNEQEVVKSLKIYAVLFSIVYAYRLINPNGFILPDSFYDKSFDELEISIMGYEFLPLLLYIYFQDYKKSPNLKNIGCIFWILALILLQRNRSTLIPVVFCSGYLFVTVKSKYKPLIIFGVVSLLTLIFATTWDTWVELYDQSVMELSNPRYNRNLALSYFLTQGWSNATTFIFGNGFISAHSSYMMAELMSKGIYNTDMGFLGYWNEFGLIPIIVFFYLIFKPLCSKKYPLYLRCYAFQVLLCSLTIMYFGQDCKIICFLLLFYLYELNKIRIAKESKISHSKISEAHYRPSLA